MRSQKTAGPRTSRYASSTCTVGWNFIWTHLTLYQWWHLHLQMTLFKSARKKLELWIFLINLGTIFLSTNFSQNILESILSSDLKDPEQCSFVSLTREWLWYLQTFLSVLPSKQVSQWVVPGMWIQMSLAIPEPKVRVSQEFHTPYSWLVFW